MKTLFLMRHAKSSWPKSSGQGADRSVDAELDPETGAGDHARPLNSRGLQAAPDMGAHLAGLLAARGQQLDLAFCSSAKRARQTWALASAELAQVPPAETRQELYLCGPDGVMSQVRQVSDAVDCLLLVSHNPDLQILATLLAGAGPAALRQQAMAHFPSGSLVGLEFEFGHWAEIEPGRGRLFEFATPKGLAAKG